MDKNIPQIRYAEFTGEWEQVTIEQIGELLKGSGLSKGLLVDNGKYKCLLYGEIFTRYNYAVKECYSRTNHLEGTKSQIGDVLMPGSTTTNGVDLAKAVAVFENDILLGGDIIIIRQKGNCYDPYFLATLLSEIDREKIGEIAQGITIMHLHASQLKNRVIFLPSLPEQEKIGELFRNLDNLIDEEQKRLDKLHALKAALLQKMFPSDNPDNTPNGGVIR